MFWSLAVWFADRYVANGSDRSGGVLDLDVGTGRFVILLYH